MAPVENVYLDPKRELQESHQLALDFLQKQFDPQSGFSVLEVGVGSGAVAKGLREIFPNVTIDAVDKFEVYLDTSKGYYDQLYCQAIEDFDNGKKYDAIILLDVLEHLENPWQVLSQLKSRSLQPNGVVAISIPNIAHWSIRRKLLRGHFRYANYGIMDKTHLRFFTLDTYNELISSCDFKITSISYTSLIKGIDDYRRFPFSLIPKKTKNPLIHQLSQRYPRYFAVQFVSLCQLNSPGS